VLPPVDLSDVAGARRSKGILLCAVHCGERETEWTLFRRKHAPPGKLADLGEIIIASRAKMRGEQNVRHQVRLTGKVKLDRQHVQIWIRRHAKSEFKPVVFVDDLDGRRARCEQPHRIFLKPLYLDPESASVGDNESKVAYLRSVDARIVNLVHNTETEREPDARRAKRTPHHVLGTAGPSRRNPRIPRSMSIEFHWTAGNGALHLSMTSTPAGRPTTILDARPTKRPLSTTPTMAERRASSAAGSGISAMMQSMM